MHTSSPSSIQSIIKQRQNEEFLGRETYLASFQKNLNVPIAAQSRKFIYAISGQGGVGKTWLLHRFLQLMERTEAVVALIDENVRDIPTTMGKLALELGSSGF